MHYFGTTLDQAGHYIWVLENNYLGRSKMRFGSTPFNPESLPISKNKNRVKGDVEFYNVFGYSILAIEGSCSDKRNGTKSIFWIEEIITYEKMMEKLMLIPIFGKIIDQMPFLVKWDHIIGDV